MRPILSAKELRRRLVAAGQDVSKATDETAGALIVFTSPDTIVTVGLNLDPTLMPEFRNRYFDCLVESKDNLVPVLQHHAAFALPEPFRIAAVQSSPAWGFQDGPFRWLIQRLLRFREVLLWPENQGDEYGPTFSRLESLDELPRLRNWLHSDTVLPHDIGAIILELTKESDCGVLWEIAGHVSEEVYNWYVGDPECKEVYLMHHHDKIEVSIPDQPVREQMLRELADRDDLFEDCSGYESTMDD